MGRLSVKKERPIYHLGLILLLALVFISTTPAYCPARAVPPPSVLLDVKDKGKVKPRILVLPYAFATDSMGMVVGLGAGLTGQYQKQLTIMGTGLVSSNGTVIGVAALNNLRPFPQGRLYIDMLVSPGKYTKQRIYTAGEPGLLLHTAGNNESDSEDYHEGRGWDNWADLHFRFLLPLAQEKDTSLPAYTLERGFPVKGNYGGKGANPLENGIILFEISPFWRDQGYNLKNRGDESFRTNGITWSLVRHNSDFPANPTYGSNQCLSISQDYGWFDSTSSYTFWELEFSKFISLGPAPGFRQRVLALNFWTADTPSWQEIETSRGISASHRPSPFRGARLGGFYRLKGFPNGRFNSKSSAYGALELRLTPESNPLGKIKLLKFLNIDWWQFVGFGQVGRVADEYNFDPLTSDLRWDFGLRLRLMATKAVVRLDMGISEEGMAVWAMVGNPFKGKQSENEVLI